MRTRHLALRAAALAVLCAVSTPAAPQTQARRTPGEIEAGVESLFEKWNRTDSPGCALGVSDAGQTPFTRAWGMADLEHDVKNTPETIFEAGSVSKQFTAAAVMLLAQASRISLDEPVRKYVPELPDYGTPLTIRHMLQHTSGLRDWGAVASIAGWPRGSRVHTHDHVLDIVSRQRALNFPPGSEHSYSNTGYNLAAVLVARRSGQSLAEFTGQSIFEPLEMRNTSWRDDHTRILKGRAIGYAAKGGGDYATDMPFEDVHGNGGLLTTVADLLRWNENHVHFRVGGTEFVKEQLRNGRLNDGTEIRYAHGIYVTRYRDVPEISHSGSTAGYRAFLARYPEQLLSIALLCNAGDANTTELAHGVADLFLDLPERWVATRVITPRQIAPAPLPPPPTWVAGLYRSLRTGEALAIVVDGPFVRLERGGAVVPVTKTRFRMPNGGFFDLELSSEGRVRRAWTTSRDGDIEQYAPVARVHPTGEKLQELVGSYVSDEAETTLTVAVENVGLVVRRRPASVFFQKPLYADAWESPLGLLRFRRDRTGHVIGLSVTVPRVREMPFERKQ